MSKNTDNHKNFDAEMFRQPLESLTGLPNMAYNSSAFAEFERDQVLSRTWFCIANLAQLGDDAWVHPVDIQGLPLLVARDKDRQVRVFHNVCSHRGMKLVEQPGPIKRLITCRYHGWCYSASGELKATPHINGEGVHSDDSFNTALHGLKEVRSQLFAGMILVNIDGQAADFDTFIEPVTSHWHEFDFDAYAHGGSDSCWEIELQGNWKFAQENHVDGYHLPFVHPDLNSYSPLRDHRPLLIEGSASGQVSLGQHHAGAIGDARLPYNPGLSQPFQDGRAEFLSIFPNIMMGVHADHVWTVHLIPLSESRTFERMDLYYFGDGATNPEYKDLRRKNRDRMLDIFEEDRDMIEGMQRGRQSPAFNGGALSPGMDQPAHCFNRIVAKAVVDALEATSAGENLKDAF
jgi:choline monooxygenase